MLYTAAMSQTIDKALFEAHVRETENRWYEALSQCDLDSVVILADTPMDYFLDDQAAPYRPNPHFAQLFPQRDCAGSALVVAPGERTRLLFYSPADYWHQPAVLPDWSDVYDVEVLASEAEVAARLAGHMSSQTRTAVVGQTADGGNLGGRNNPSALLNHVHYQRAWKSEFELQAMRTASRLAAAGHAAAASCFQDGGSEFDIHLAYLSAARLTPEELPYSSIVALNNHAGVLHYQHYDRQAPAQLRSFLIDAGASCCGYASDVTRSYAAPGEALYASLISTLDAAQLTLIDQIRPGQAYLQLHERMHLQISQILKDHGLIDCTAEAAVANGISRAFLPHGLGHLIGLQTHDVGGQQLDELGTQAPPPEHYPALRFTRELSAGMVFTIEPGIYFIPMLLEQLRAEESGKHVNWGDLETLLGCGGIRIEDNIVVTQQEPENLTRNAFAELATPSA